ncbi:MAG: roadblock/LC7 domain-containing protein [Promethearchaeota archaeon]
MIILKNNFPENKYKNITLRQVFDEIKEKGKFLGIVFAYRNGELIFQNIGNNIDSIKFASMCASVLEGATELGQTIGHRKINKIIAELEEKTLIIIECDKKSFFTLIINKESQVDIILNQLDHYNQLISELY